MDRNTIRLAFITSLPVLMGYLAIGIAFGVMLVTIGYNAVWAFIMSLTIYAGSAQYIAVELLDTGAKLAQIALITLFINFRHVVYGISMLEKFRGMGIRKLYMILSLTDETYALLASAKVPVNIDSKKFYFYLALLNHLYWISGSVIGAVAGALIEFNTHGIEFAMTAMFIVIATEQWMNSKIHLSALIGAGGTLLSLAIFGRDNMLLPALFIMVLLLFLLHGKLEDNTNSRSKEAAKP